MTSPAQKGFSLVELMVAVTLSLLLVAAMITLYLNVSRSNQEMAKTNSQIENGRFAIQVIEHDLEHAGFWGDYVPAFDDLTAAPETPPGDAPTALPAPCTNYASWPTTPAYKHNLLGIAAQLYDSVPSGCATLLKNKQPDTDILLVRHAAMCAVGDADCATATAGELYFQVSRCPADAEKFVLDTDAAKFILRKRNCTLSAGADPHDGYAEKRKFVSNIYYVRDYGVAAGDGIPTLMRASFYLSGTSLAPQTPEPIIGGIQGFRVELGIDDVSDDGSNIIAAANSALKYDAAIKWDDPAHHISAANRGDGVPDVYVRPPLTLAQNTHVVAAKIYVLARTDEPTPDYTDTKIYTLGSATLGPFNDHYKRHVFMTTVRLNNIAGRRETP
ncbi:MAG: PilW family protein [Methylobacillus sp.]|jgi:type IV pilus assembly protein PilW|nr:PilW family protein [Methylobacillus sp.]